MNILGNELAPKVWNRDQLCTFTASSPSPQGIFVFVTVGGEKGAGHFLLAGGEEEVAGLGPKLAVVTNVPESPRNWLHSLLQGGRHLRGKGRRSQRSLPRQGQSHGESQAGRRHSATDSSNSRFLMNIVSVLTIYPIYLSIL